MHCRNDNKVLQSEQFAPGKDNYTDVYIVCIYVYLLDTQSNNLHNLSDDLHNLIQSL